MGYFPAKRIDNLQPHGGRHECHRCAAEQEGPDAVGGTGCMTNSQRCAEHHWGLHRARLVMGMDTRGHEGSGSVLALGLMVVALYSLCKVF